ncbi:MAG: hypothetical protein AB8G05_05495 [Oligoflexales bacterium]
MSQLSKQSKQTILNTLKWSFVAGFCAIKLVKTFRQIKWRSSDK